MNIPLSTPSCEYSHSRVHLCFSLHAAATPGCHSHHPSGFSEVQVGKVPACNIVPAPLAHHRVPCPRPHVCHAATLSSLSKAKRIYFSLQVLATVQPRSRQSAIWPALQPSWSHLARFKAIRPILTLLRVHVQC